MRSFIFAAVSAFASGSLASVANSHVVHEVAIESPAEWTKLNTLSKDEVLPVRIGLTQLNLDHGHNLLMDISDPSSGKYGQHLTADEVRDLFAPHDDSIDAVQSWLQSEGIEGDRISRSPNLQWIQFDASVAELEDLLKTKYDVYEHQETGARSIGADSYSIPRDVQAHIDYITPAATKMQIQEERENKKRSTASANFPSRQILKERAESTVTKNCSKIITPHCIRNMYDIPIGTKSVKGNDLGIYSLQPFSQKWLNRYFKDQAPFVPHGTKPIVKNVNGGAESGVWSEMMLDLEVAYPIISPQDIQVFSVDMGLGLKNGFFNTFLDALDGSYCNRTAFGETGDNPKFDPKYPSHQNGGWNHPEMCGVYKPPKVISISWGVGEHQRTVSYDRRQCSEWMKLALQGVTVVAASGDHGVQSFGQCLKTSGGERKVFPPSSLVNCPYVVSVGGTHLPPGEDAGTGQEIAAHSFYSGGGFSNIYPTPKWQQKAVDQYFHEKPGQHKSYKTKLGKNIGAHNGIFNRAGRGYPDVAAVGQNMYTWQGTPFIMHGTSASAPLFASVINRINGERMKKGKSSVGFILPALYAHPHVFHDITKGNNPGCKTDGFEATKGWDPVTGLGTPDYPKMLDLFMSLP